MLPSAGRPRNELEDQEGRYQSFSSFPGCWNVGGATRTDESEQSQAPNIQANEYRGASDRPRVSLVSKDHSAFVSVFSIWHRVSLSGRHHTCIHIDSMIDAARKGRELAFCFFPVRQWNNPHVSLLCACRPNFNPRPLFEFVTTRIGLTITQNPFSTFVMFLP